MGGTAGMHFRGARSGWEDIPFKFAWLGDKEHYDL